MRARNKQFLGIPASAENANVLIVPLAYEGGISYGKGTVNGPEAIINASKYLELYDEILEKEPYKTGIFTVEDPQLPENPEYCVKEISEVLGNYLETGKFIVSIGGDHSVTQGFVKALKNKYGNLSVIQFDAHADLREKYDGSIYSHACVMARIREMTNKTLQIGVRSLSAVEAERIRKEKLPVFMMHELREKLNQIETAINRLPDPVFITIDVDVFDWSVIRSTGTPEPGGLLWDETIQLLSKIFKNKNVVGFDVVELSANPEDHNSAFAAAKLIYKMIGMKSYCKTLIE